MVNGEYFKTFDLATGAQLTEVRTGRMSMKLLQALESGLNAEAARLEAENEARREGRSYYAYTQYTLTQPRGTMAIRPDGKAVYALNSQTEDLTVIDGVSGAILQKVPAGGFSVLFMPAASVALVPSASALHAVDLTTHQKKADVVTGTTGNFDQAELSPDGRLAVIHGIGRRAPGRRDERYSGGNVQDVRAGLPTWSSSGAPGADPWARASLTQPPAAAAARAATCAAASSHAGLVSSSAETEQPRSRSRPSATSYTQPCTDTCCARCQAPADDAGEADVADLLDHVQLAQPG